MINQNSAVSTLNKTIGANECPKCKVWKRINQECRNFIGRADFSNINNAFKMLGELSEIESLKRMTPELSKSLIAVKDGLK